MIEEIFDNNELLAIIIRNDYRGSGITFFTNQESALQLGYMNRPSNYIIAPHVHNSVKREITQTQEVLFIKKGKVQIDFFSSQRQYLRTELLLPGDIVLLSSGGHGFQMLEESEIFEVKQGPFCGELDKTRF